LLAATLAGTGFVALALLLRLWPHALATGDAAVAEIFVLHASRGAWALGPYSQFYWNHPGPLMFYLLAPLYAVSGQHAQALNVGATLLNLLAVAGLLRLAGRGRDALATVAVAGALTLWLVRVPESLSSFWNPVLIALPALLFVWLSAAVAGGRAAAMVPLAAVGSFLAQSHVGLVPPVGVLWVVALAASWRRAGRDAGPDRRRWRRWLAASGGLAVLVWALPLIEAVTEQPGNLSLIARFFASTPPGQRTIAQSATMWAGALVQAAAPGFHQPTGVPLPVLTRPGMIAAGVAMVTLLTAMAWRTRSQPGLSLPAAFHLLIVLVALAAIHRSPGLVGDYTIFWLAPIGASAGALIAGWALGSLIGGAGAGEGAVAKAGAGAAAGAGAGAGAEAGAGATAAMVVRGLSWLSAAVLVLAVGIAARDLRAHFGSMSPPPQSGPPPLSRQTRDALRVRGISDPAVVIADGAWAEAAATLVQMYKAREPFAVDPAWTFMYGRPLTQARCHAHRLRFSVGDVAGSGEMIAAAGPVRVSVEALGTCPGR
jgi:hypothetical protein